MKRSEIKAGEIYVFQGSSGNAAPVRVVSTKPHKVSRVPNGGLYETMVREVEDARAGVLVEKVSPEEIPGFFNYFRLSGSDPHYVADLRQITGLWSDYAESQRKAEEARARYAEEDAHRRAEWQAQTQALLERTRAAGVEIKIPAYGDTVRAYSSGDGGGEVVIRRDMLLRLLVQITAADAAISSLTAEVKRLAS